MHDFEADAVPGGRGTTVKLLGSGLEGLIAAVAAQQAFEVTMANIVR